MWPAARVFAFETTLSGRAYARQIPQWQALGYRAELFFLSLPSADMAVQRVAERVRQGGHNLPEATIRRRFEAGWRLLTEVYQPLVDQWVLFDNAGDEPVLDGLARQTMTTPKPVNEPAAVQGPLPAGANADIKGSLAAMCRAAQRARQVAQQTGTDLIVVRAGQVVRVAMSQKAKP